MKEKPLVSIIIPVYNSAPFIERCLESVLLQDYENLEIICIDDGSTDKSLELLKALKERAPNLVILEQDNKGPGAARNLGLDKSSGEFVCFLDSDDRISENFISELLCLALRTRSDIAATSSVLLDYGNYLKEKDVGLPKNFVGELFSLEDRAKIVRTTGVSCNKLYKKSFLQSNNIFYLTLNSPSEDNYFSIPAIFLANQIAVTFKCSYFYLQHSSSITKKIISYQSLDTFLIYSLIFQRMSLLPLRWDARKIILKTISERLEIDASYVEKKLENNFLPYFKKQRELTLRSLANSIQLVNKQKQREPQIIISLTSYPKRIKTVDRVVNSILHQTVKPDKIILWLAQEEFPDKVIPEEIERLQNNIFQIRWCDNLRSYKKLIPALIDFPEEIIITVDDDVIYPPNLIEVLYRSYLRERETIHCNRCHWIRLKEGKLLSYQAWKQQDEFKASNASYLNFLTGLGGVLYPPHCLDKKVFDRSLYERLCPTGDDIWFWAMAVMNGTKIKRPKEFIRTFEFIEGSQDSSLWDLNKFRNDSQLSAVMNEFPILQNRLIRDKITTEPLDTNKLLLRIKRILLKIFPRGSKTYIFLRTVYTYIFK